MIRYIRILGAALGGAIGLVLATSGGGLFSGRDYAGAFLAAWVVAWIVVGFAILPYLTVVPAQWLIKRVEELSTAEFVAAVTSSNGSSAIMRRAMCTSKGKAASLLGDWISSE